ncbi:serine/threonine-protein kinase [Vibrio cholerae]|uniref:serine/threonine-protein kinase n=1 Tax=Vibrio cholerae TaxID=666 RepID=UPI000A5AB3A6|nr:serine/threonine-protein kinase [Vibrio cholerae]
MNSEYVIGRLIKTELGELKIINFLGKGKSGYSYLAEDGFNKYVLKFMHYEHCPYYDFGDANKVDIEACAYETLKQCGVKVPALLLSNKEQGYIVKEYIDGELITDLIINGSLPDSSVIMMLTLSNNLKRFGFNIDYFPDNFVLHDDVLYYVDYEINAYNKEWDFENWGIYYWANSDGMRNYHTHGDSKYINLSEYTGKPIKEPFEDQVCTWLKLYLSS